MIRFSIRCVALLGPAALLASCGVDSAAPQTPSAASCPTNATQCGTICADLSTDVANCGSCGTICPPSTTCTFGSCVCPTGRTACPAGCVDLQSDPSQCGACGTACPSGQVCSAGACKGGCDAGLTLCGASCVDTGTSTDHCGLCDNVCGSGLDCVEGACGCPGGLLACGTECVDATTNSLHCGGCGRPCAGGQTCVSGACVGGGAGGSGGTGAGGSGGAATGGDVTGGAATGGEGAAGSPAGGAPTGGTATGGDPAGGVSPTGGDAAGGTPTGGSTPGELHGCTATIDEATLTQEYSSWKDAYVVACSDSQARVQAGGSTPGSESNETFSEGIGYGMLLAVAFDDQPLLDQLWAYYLAGRNSNGLMNWKMNACTGTPYEVNGASDGDLDTAMALVQADRKWGGYTADANALLDAIHTYETMECGALTVLRPGDAWGLECTTGNLNPSYFCPGYYRAFAVFQAEQAAFWNKLADDSITLLLDYQQEAGGALMGEWSYTDRLADTSYGYNACRTPWRVAVDFAWWGTAGAQTYLANVASYVDAQGGVASVPFDKNSAFLGPFALSGIATDQCDAYYQSWMGGAQYDDRYFQGTLRVLALTLLAGKFTF